MQTSPSTNEPNGFEALTAFGEAEWAAEEQRLAVFQADHTALFHKIGLIESAQEAILWEEEKASAERAAKNEKATGEAYIAEPPRLVPHGIIRAAVWRDRLAQGHLPQNQLVIERYKLRLITTYLSESEEVKPYHQSVDVASTWGGMVYPYENGFTVGECNLVVAKGRELQEAALADVLPHLSYDLMHITRPEVVKALEAHGPLWSYSADAK